MKALLLALLFVLCAPSVFSIEMDCSLPENQPKCKSREGDVAMISGSEQLVNSVKDLVREMDSLSNGATTEAQMEEARVQMSFVSSIMANRQDEINFVVGRLVPQSYSAVAVLYKQALALKANASKIVDDMRHMDMAGAVGIEEQQQIVHVIEKLQAMRSQIESGYLAASDKPAANLLQQSQSLVQRIDRALRHRSSHQDVDDLDDVAMLQVHAGTGTGTVYSLADRTIRILDELIEEFKHVRSLVREISSAQREGAEDSAEHTQMDVERLIAAAHTMHKWASEEIELSRRLRIYLRELTASQYGSLTWYALAQQKLRGVADLLDSSTRLVAAATPLFDELLHYLHEGDSPYLRTDVSALSCDSRQDSCGVCGGHNLTCVACDGVVRGNAVVDVCGECAVPTLAGAKCSYFCDGVANSGKVKDMCGVCAGDDSVCRGCDGLVNSGKVYDRCGLCGGDGTTCKLQGCANVVCPPSDYMCPPGMHVTGDGYQGCCFNAFMDCVKA